MDTKLQPSKQARREFSRWKKVLEMVEQGKTTLEIAVHFDVTTNQIYALIARAKAAREKGWI